MEKTVKTIRKNIDLPVETLHDLSIQAVDAGLSLKRYIETVLKQIADREDVELYEKYIKNNPECWEPVNETEQKEFEQWLREA